MNITENINRVDKPIRLSKVVKELNVGINTIIEFLYKRGISIESNPNTKLAPDIYDLLVRHFIEKTEDEPVSEEKPVEEKKSVKEKEIKVVGKIDIDSIKRITKKPVEEKKSVKEKEIKVVGKIDIDSIKRITKKPVVIRDFSELASIKFEGIQPKPKLYKKPTPKPQEVDLTKVVEGFDGGDDIEREKIAVLKQYKIKFLFHITHKDNLDGILCSGFLSHNAAHKRGLVNQNIAEITVNTRRSMKVDTIYRRNLHDYVPLYFNPRNPMLYARRNLNRDLLILIVEPNLIYRQNSIFTDGNAASRQTSFYNQLSDLARLRWECIFAEYWNDFEDGKRIRCAEVLVFPCITIQSIKYIVCHNMKTSRYVLDKLPTNSHIKVKVNKNDYY